MAEGGLHPSTVAIVRQAIASIAIELIAIEDSAPGAIITESIANPIGREAIAKAVLDFTNGTARWRRTRCIQASCCRVEGATRVRAIFFVYTVRTGAVIPAACTGSWNTGHHAAVSIWCKDSSRILARDEIDAIEALTVDQAAGARQLWLAECIGTLCSITVIGSIRREAFGFAGDPANAVSSIVMHAACAFGIA